MKIISLLSVGNFVATPTGLIVNGKPSFDEWLTYGKHLQEINQALQMLIGDWLNEGEKRYGETYAQATEIFPEAQLSTLKNWKWVASRVTKSARIDGLHYSHYLAVASLESETAREAWLKEAKRQNMNSNELKAKVNPKPTPPPVSLREALLAIGDSISDARGTPYLDEEVDSFLESAAQDLALAIQIGDAKLAKETEPASVLDPSGKDDTSDVSES